MALGRTTWLIIRKERGFVNTFFENFSKNFSLMINDKKVEYTGGYRVFLTCFLLVMSGGRVSGIRNTAKKNKKISKIPIAVFHQLKS